MNGNVNSVTIFIKLLGEGIEVWRPVSAVPVKGGFMILPDDHDPSLEEWEFTPGKVVCVSRNQIGDFYAEAEVEQK